MEDITITITTVIAIISLISPIITTLLNNHYQLKIKRLEAMDKRYNDLILYKINALQSYCQSLSKIIIYPNEESFIEYGKDFGKAIIYMTEEQAKIATEIYKKFQKRKLDENSDFSDVCCTHLLEIKNQIAILETKQI